MSGRTDAHDGGRSRWTSHGSVQQSAKSPCWLCFSRWTRDIYKHAVSQKPVLQKQGGVNMQLLCSAVNCQSRMYYGHLLPVRTPGTPHNHRIHTGTFKKWTQLVKKQSLQTHQTDKILSARQRHAEKLC